MRIRDRVNIEWWYLAYLGFLAFQPIFDPGAGLFAWSAAAVIALSCIGLYAVACAHHGRRRYHAMVGLALLGTVGSLVNIGAFTCLVFAAAFAGSLGPRRRVLRWLWGLSAAMGVAFLASPVPLPWRLLSFLPPLVMVWMVGFTTMGETRRAREAALLRIENRTIEHNATQGERERIARDLHDLLGQSLTSLVVRAQLIQRLATVDAGRAADEARLVEEAARDALREVRGAVAGWRRVRLTDELTVARETLEVAGVTGRFAVDLPDDVGPMVESALGLCLREAVTNVVRHAHADHCEVTLTHHDDVLQLTVADDGLGDVGPGGVGPGDVGAEGNGLTGMRERIAGIGGQVHRTVRRGTVLTVSVPHAARTPAAGDATALTGRVAPPGTVLPGTPVR